MGGFFHHVVPSNGAEDPALEVIVDGVTIDCTGQFSALGTVSWLLVGWGAQKMRQPAGWHCWH